ncbi:hypothetical protein DPMN_010126 [Dreissena polymorpha]|uniref:Uncharacterized protein n=1 Tax=Dreissena polymorpha TaxID=45954 RepID=A0A9D4S0N9_DREPO|nr:hypothetical protein DPMN_010126 [Dreissena polymorpha]
MSKFHEVWAKNESSRLFTCFHYLHIKKTAPPPSGHVFSLIITIFNHVQDIHITNLLTKFHDDKAKNVTPRVKKTPPPDGHKTNVLTKFHEDWEKYSCFHYIHIEKTAPPPGGHVFPPIMTIFELVRDIYKINAKNVTSRVFTSFFYYTNMRKMTPPGGHVFLPIQTIFKLNRHIHKTHVLTKFHEDWT